MTSPPSFYLPAISPPALTLWHRLTGSRVTQDFCLGGGTALAWHLGHRLSVDLDFFTPMAFEPLEMHSHLQAFDAAFGLKENMQVLSTAPNTLCLHITGVKVDLLKYSYPMLAAPLQWEGKRILALPDLAAMKLSAAANRGTKKDFFDLAALLDRFTLKEMLEFYEGKFSGFSTLPVMMSLTYFTGAEGDPDPVSLVGLTWQEVQLRLTAAARGVS